MSVLTKRIVYVLLSLFLCLCLPFGLSRLPVAKADTTASATFNPYAIVNGDFEQPPSGNQIPGWDDWTQSGNMSLDSRAHAGSNSLNMTNGFISVWNSSPVVNLNQENAPHPGDLVQASVWVQVPDASTDLSKPFELWVEEVDGSGTKHMIASAQLPTDAPRGQWVQLTTTPVDGGIIQSSTQNLVVSFQDYVAGTILVDDFQVGYLQRGLTPPSSVPKPSMYNVVNSSFEDGLDAPWGTWSTQPDTVTDSNDGYYGTHSVQMENLSSSDSSSLWQTISMGTASGQPQVGDSVEAGAWVKLLPGATPATGKSLTIEVDGVNSNGDKTVLAQSADMSKLPIGVWTYVLTQPVSGQTVTKDMTGIVVSVQDEMQGGVLVDYLQAGQVNSLTGDPQKFVMAEYQPWYGGPGNWHNWQWSDTKGVIHNPDNILPNGQRDIAAYYYPLVGVYNSTDPSLLQYQVDMMKAMGVDCLLVDYYANLEPDDLTCLNELLNIADKSDMKVAIFYEPKIHTYNWIPSSSKQDEINGVVNDITSFIDQYGNHKSILRVRNRPVVGVFGATNTGLSSSDWAGIMQTIHNQGYNPYMIGDVAAVDPPSSFDGMMDWNLYQDTLAQDNSYANVEKFSAQSNASSAQWAAADPVHRLGVGIVWPGFNDTGVDGWGAGPRVIQYNPDFYSATWDGMLTQNLHWVVIATFNDFTESTSIEPSRELGYSRAITTSKYIAQFKGTQPVTDAKVYQKILQEYDHTPPAISVSQPMANGNYLDSQTVTVDETITDGQSGVNALATQSVLDGNPVNSGAAINLYTLPLGNHKLTISASDYLGNTATQTVTFTTGTSVASIEDMVQLFQTNGSIDNSGIANSLEQKLQNHDVQSFVNEVEAQSGQHIQTVEANYLLRDGEWLLNN